MAARMRWYVPQRQMLVIAVSMSASVGCGVFASSAAAAMICPDWQYPHCGTSSSIHARCTACARFLERPSIVVTRLPATAATGSTQVRVATPSRWTVQAPHCAMPQPNLVPVSPSVSRSTQRSGVSGVTSTVSRLPLTVKEIGGMTSFPLRRGLVNNVHRRPARWKGAHAFRTKPPEACSRGRIVTEPSQPRITYARRVGIFSATMAVMGGIIGSGVFLGPEVVAARVGSAGLTLTAWVVGGVIALAGALCFGELGARRPRAGGGYVYLREAFGPLPAFLYGWGLLLVIAP